MLLSTGLSTLEEVAATVEFVRRINPGYNDEGRIVLLQCTAMYPLEDADVHLRAMETLRSIPGVSVGFSDHTVGGAALRVAAAMGAQVLEFHFTDRREDRTFRDHKISLLPDEVAQLIEDLRHIGVLRGRAEKIPAAVEQAAGHVASFRRALYPARDLPAGTVLAPGDLVCLRPNVGLDAREVDRVVGRTLACGVKKYQRLAWDLFAPDPRA
jgi:N,N'-diacetyllegionaminate synthase